MRQRALGIGLGLALGAALAALGIVIAPDGQADSTTTTAAVATGPSVWWHDPHETIVDTAAVILESLSVEGDTAVLEYRVEPITSATLGASFTDPDPPIAMEDWVLETTNGDYRGSSDRHHATRVRFDVDAGFSVDGVTGVRIERYRARLPYRFEADLPLSVGARAQLDEDVSVVIVSVLPQRSTVIVGVGIQRPQDVFTSGSVGFIAQALDSRWSFPSSRTPSPDTPDAWQLVWPDPEAPDRIRLKVGGTRWVVRDANISLDIGGLQRA